MNIKERRECLKILAGHISLGDLLASYDIEFEAPKHSRKGGNEYSFACPWHSTISKNYTMNDSNLLGFCRSAYCGVKHDLISLIAKLEHIDNELAFDHLCDIAGLNKSDFGGAALTLAVLNSVGRKKEKLQAKLTPLVLPKDYIVVAHPYMVEARGIDPVVLVEACAGAVLQDPFHRYRAAIPVRMGGKVFSLYSRATASQEAWMEKFPDDAKNADRLYPKHHYTGESLTSRLLYGVDDFEDRSEIILVEAIISVLKLRTFGFGNACALLKAAISDEQAKILLRRGTKKILICTDNDEKIDQDTKKAINPGMKASWNIYRRLRDYFEIGVVRMPINVDPADLNDRSEFKKILEKRTLWPQRRVTEKKFVQEMLGCFN